MKITKTQLKQIIKEEISNVNVNVSRKGELLDAITQTLIRLGHTDAQAANTAQKWSGLSEKDLRATLNALHVAVSKMVGLPV